LVSSHGQEEQAKDLYVPRVEDKNRSMRMLKITNMDDLVKSSMDILEPSPLDANGNDREDGMKFILILLFLL
jgi:5-formyltetrahydrofolate cyclo-ligase